MGILEVMDRLGKTSACFCFFGPIEVANRFATIVGLSNDSIDIVALHAFTAGQPHAVNNIVRKVAEFLNSVEGHFGLIYQSQE